jgi:hypothetical protein
VARIGEYLEAANPDFDRPLTSDFGVPQIVTQSAIFEWIIRLGTIETVDLAVRIACATVVNATRSSGVVRLSAELFF